MRFIDEAIIKVAGGHGGPGCVSFRRETFVPRGGPDGGDGGRGGQIVLRASKQLSTLQDFRFRKSYQGGAGNHGSGANKSGRDGEDILIKVPVGTIVKHVETQEILVDFTEDGQTWIAVKGGRGGKGNAHFVSSTFQAPKFAQPGEDGESLEIQLELKLLADVGIIGFPNAGKSTLISVMSAAKPKIADYPFTTLTPHLGVVRLDLQSFVIADIPGLVEGAHRGVGLGHKFLKHMERTRLFVHLLDGQQLLEDLTASSFDEAIEKLLSRYQQVRTELGLFNPELLDKPELVVLNKLDLLQSGQTVDWAEPLRERFRTFISKERTSALHPAEPFFISAATRYQVQELTADVLQALRAPSDDDAPMLPDDSHIRR